MSTVLIETDTVGVTTLRLNRPDRFNALDLNLLGELRDVLTRLTLDDDCKALVITGNGKAFCAGADLNAFVELRAQGQHRDAGHQVSDTMKKGFNPVMALLADFPKPVVSAVNGIAAGGGAGLALCADVVLCGAAGKFKFVQATQLGIVADLGANWLLPRIAGRAVALAAILLGETLDARRAESLGLVWEVVDDDALLARAQTLAAGLARVPAEVVVATRAMVDASASAGFRQILDLERVYQRDFCATPSVAARIESFVAGSKAAPKP